MILGRGNRGTDTALSPDLAMSSAGAGAGLHMPMLCPREANSRAIGIRRVTNPKSFVNNIVNKKRFIAQPFVGRLSLGNLLRYIIGEFWF